MEVIIRGEPKEIAALAVAIQERRKRVAALENTVQVQQMAKTVMAELNQKAREGGSTLLLG